MSVSSGASRVTAESEAADDAAVDIESDRVDASIDGAVFDAATVTLERVEQLVTDLETAWEEIKQLEAALDAECAWPA